MSTSAASQQEIVVGHLPVSLDGVLRDVNQTIKYRASFIADDGFVQLAAVAVTFVVLKPRARIAHF